MFAVGFELLFLLWLSVYLPIDVTESGIAIDVSSLHFANTLSPMFVTEFGITIVVSERQA